MIRSQKKETPKDTDISNARKIRFLAQYRASSRREREIMWIRHEGLRELFDQLEKAEIFIARKSSSGFSVHRFNHSSGNFIEYQTMF